MKNRDIYQKDPSIQKLVNEGVANVNYDKSKQALDVLRYELDTFVCDGQYEKGLEHILYTYLKNIDQAQQPAVWVSGFYGSGKSHLVKMLRALWENTEFEDGATARGIATLPQSIKDHFKELDTQSKRHGGLHAASGTLGSGASGSVRLALLRVVFTSAGLPGEYPVARFIMWLKAEDIYDEVKKQVEKSSHDWQEEIDNFYVAEGLHEALVKIKPNLFSSPTTCVETLNNLYPYVQDISNDQMVKAINQALIKDGKFPLMLIVLDEVQQFIGEDSDRSHDVQEAVEACCKQIGSKLLFIGTGQTAVTGTSNLKRLEGRFTIRIELSDADVDAVIRKVILAKKADSISLIDSTMQTNLGEISRHLSDTTIGHRQEDIQYFPQDYPILPVRRRFWENTLRVLDQTGTDSQLRNQLSMVHKVIQTNLDADVGNVVPADYLYFESVDKLLQSRILPKKVHEKTMTWLQGTEDERFMARACGLVFLINKLSSSNQEVAIKANINTLADLMVEDLSKGSSALRAKLPRLLDKCKLLMKVGDEYRIQTEESSAWNDEFLSQRGQLNNEVHRIEAERDDRIRKKFGELTRKLTLTHGASKVTREALPTFDSNLPHDSDKKIYVWVRDEWEIDENSVRVDARQAGSQSPTLYVFIPKRSAEALRHNLIDYKAAAATLDKRGAPSTAEGKEARAAMETTKQLAEGKIKEFLDDAFSGARLFQGGGNEVLGNNLQEIIHEGARNSLQRLYPQFKTADHSGWEKVYSNAKKGAPDALKAVGDDGEPTKNGVCKAILAHIGAGKKGTEIRSHFEGATYGWSGDAVDGGLQVLLIAGLIRAQDDKGQPIDPKELERKQIGKVFFKVESTVITTAQRLQIRKVLQKAGCKFKQGEELSAVPMFLDTVFDLAERAGGEPPQPEKPETQLLTDIKLSAGNEQLLAVYNNREELIENIIAWEKLAKSIDKRMPNWKTLKELLNNSGEIKEAKEARQQVEAIEHQRRLLDDPDLVLPLLKSLEGAVRKVLKDLDQKYEGNHSSGMERLRDDDNWKLLEPEQRNQLLSEQKLTINDRPEINVQNIDEILGTLRVIPLELFRERVQNMKARFDTVLERAAELLEPDTQFISIPRPTMKTEEEIDAWAEDVKKSLKKALKKGPIRIQ